VNKETLITSFYQNSVVSNLRVNYELSNSEILVVWIGFVKNKFYMGYGQVGCFLSHPGFDRFTSPNIFPNTIVKPPSTYGGFYSAALSKIVPVDTPINLVIAFKIKKMKGGELVRGLYVNNKHKRKEA